MQHAQTGLRIAGGVAGIAMLAAMTAGTGGVGLVAVGVAAGGATIVALGAGAVAICLGIRAAHVTYRGVKGLQHYARRLRAQKLLRQEEMAKWRAGVIAGEIAKQTRYPRPVPESERQPFRIDSAAYSFGIGWDAKGRVDADLAAVVFDESGVIVCVVNGLGESLSFADGAISHTGDDKLGGKESRMRGRLPDNESILIDFAKLPENAHTIVIALIINESKDAEVANAYVRGFPLKEMLSPEEYEAMLQKEGKSMTCSEDEQKAALNSLESELSLEQLVEQTEGVEFAENGEDLKLTLPGDVMFVVLDEEEIGMCNGYVVAKLEKFAGGEWEATPIRQAVEGVAIADLVPEMTEHVCERVPCGEDASALDIRVEVLQSWRPVHLTVLVFDRFNRLRAVSDHGVAPLLDDGSEEAKERERRRGAQPDGAWEDGRPYPDVPFLWVREPVTMDSSASLMVSCWMPPRWERDIACDVVQLVPMDPSAEVVGAGWTRKGEFFEHGASSVLVWPREQAPVASPNRWKFVGRRNGERVIESHPIAFNRYASHALPQEADSDRREQELKELQAAEMCLVRAAQDGVSLSPAALATLGCANVFVVAQSNSCPGDPPVFVRMHVGPNHETLECELRGDRAHCVGKVTCRPIGHPMPFPLNTKEWTYVHYAMELPTNAVASDVQRIFVPEVIKSLWLNILGGKGLESHDERTGLADPFVRIRYDDKRIASTDVAKKTLDPEWNWESDVGLVIDAITSKPKVELEVLDRDRLSRNDSMGKVTLELNDMYLPWTGAYPVVDGTGSIFIELDYELLDVVPHISAPVDLMDTLPDEGFQRTKAQQASKEEKRRLFGRHKFWGSKKKEDEDTDAKPPKSKEDSH
eukprot:TRINITY_DN3464_c0_g1_i1.p1 TRINITY_DN3464_c0_g1~~TRINITY_DN3464_c0_g1_i1.p1  ORF type:complete len:928 (+),score=343.54 TRINITY_DN3464_c0_g1_i1:183-2786(+)